MTIQIKASEQYFPVVLFVMMYKVVPKFESVTIKMKTTEQSFLVVLFIITYEVRGSGFEFFCEWESK